MSGRARVRHEPEGAGAPPAQDGSVLNASAPPLPGPPDIATLRRDASCEAKRLSQSAGPGCAPVPELLAAPLHRIPLSQGVHFSHAEAAPGRRPLSQPGLPPVLPAPGDDGPAGALGQDEAALAKTQQPGFVHEERARAVLWGLKSSAGVIDAVKSLLTSVGSSFRGDVVVGEPFTSKGFSKSVVCFVGSGAHDAALHVVQHAVRDKPWTGCSEHNREWHCPTLQCLSRLNFQSHCPGCNLEKPKLTESKQILMQQLSNQRGSFSPVRSLTPVHIWKNVIGRTSVLFSDNVIFLSFSKRDLSVLRSLQGSRLWAFDCHVGSDAKCWVWSKDADSFIEKYFRVSACARHAYEVIPPDTPCRMLYDLDMCIEHGLNADKDHARMVELICKSGI